MPAELMVEHSCGIVVCRKWYEDGAYIFYRGDTFVIPHAMMLVCFITSLAPLSLSLVRRIGIMAENDRGEYMRTARGLEARMSCTLSRGLI